MTTPESMHRTLNDGDLYVDYGPGLDWLEEGATRMKNLQFPTIGI